jgi:hypothetical protein
VGLANLGSESETCVGSRVRLVGVSVFFEKKLYRLPFTPPLWFAVSVLQKNTQQCRQSEEVQEDEELKELSTSMDMLLNRLEERVNFKKDRQALQDSMNTSRNSSLMVHKSAPNQEKIYNHNRLMQVSIQVIIPNNLCFES